MADTLDVLVVGAGFSGLYLLHKLRGLGFSVRVVDRAAGVGGTWYWNRYPGAACDIESIHYSYSFSEELQQEWNWSTRYALQPEILRYLEHVADRFDLRKDIQLNTDVREMAFDEEASVWKVHVANANTKEKGEELIHARFCVMATGCLSQPKRPDFEGVESFKGKTYLTSEWPHEGVDFTGLRVGVIGTGSSGVQSIPLIAEQAKSLVVFQRTPSFAVPAHNGPLDSDLVKEVKAHYNETREANRNNPFGFDVGTRTEVLVSQTPAEEIQAEYDRRWGRGGFYFLGAFGDLFLNREANETACEYVRKKILETVKDADLAKTLSPTTYPIGAKRMCIDTDYYKTYTRDHVSLVDIKSDPIEKFTEQGITLKDGKHYEFDAVVFATGFDAMTGALLNINIKGRGGVTLREKWAEGPKTYLGLAVAGFPNLFTVTGPGSPSVLTNMVISIEQHVDWISDCLMWLKSKSIRCIEANEEAQQGWVDHVNMVANFTLFVQADSWYLGANVPGKPRVFMPYCGGIPLYKGRCDQVAQNGYEGFETKA